MKIIFFGTPEFSAVILEALIDNNYLPVLTVTASDKPVGRKKTITPPPVKVLAKQHNIKVLQPKNLEDIKQDIDDISPDLIIVAAYGPPFLSKEVLAMPRHGCLNVHPSLLPKYRGASPIAASILNGETETGVTIIRMAERIDQGDIVSQEKIKVLSRDTTLFLTKKLAELGSNLLIKTIPSWLEGKIISKPQGDSPTLYCPQLKKEDGKINWENQAEYIERQIRAFYPWPGTFTFFKGKALKILKTYVLMDRVPNISSYDIQEEIQTKPGFVFLTKDKKLAVQTGKGLLMIGILQLEGKKPMPGQEFLKGHQDIINTILE